MISVNDISVADTLFDVNGIALSDCMPICPHQLKILQEILLVTLPQLLTPSARK